MILSYTGSKCITSSKATKQAALAGTDRNIAGVKPT